MRPEVSSFHSLLIPNSIVSHPMKHTVIRVAMLASLVAGGLSSVSCETTGDPSTGGIFWSEHKAQARLDERQARLNHIEARTDAAQARARAKQREINRLKAEKADEDKKQ